MIKRELVNVPIKSIRVSRFNTRKVRGPEHIEKLAERIKRNGFETTRAIWVVKEGAHYEVFAGGTRFQASMMAGLTQIPAFVFTGATNEDIARLETEDNENDEYHERVSVLDVWAECHRLNKDEGWTQEQIAKVKKCDVPTVSRRVKLHTDLCKAARKATCDGLFDEGHAVEVLGVTCDIATLNPWLTTDQAQTGVTSDVLAKHRGKTLDEKDKDRKPSVAVVREAAKRWRDMIALAASELSQFDESDQGEFVAALVSSKARTSAAVQSAAATIKKAIAKRRADECAKAKEEADKAERESRVAEFKHAFTSRIVLGDARRVMDNAPDRFGLLLTDPPYGNEYESSRRVTTARKGKIANDTLEDALSLLSDVLSIAYRKMASDSTLLVFTGWQHEPEFRSVITGCGFEIKGSLVWVKNNHGSGDLKGAFAPKHERIIHAVKGNPALAKRIPDVLAVKDQQNTDHPTQKPVDLLAQLIMATCGEGATVCDPFAGSGTTLYAAHQCGCDFWGCEVDPKWHGKIADALLRLAEAEIQAPEVKK